MARRIRHPSLESCTARFKLPIRGKPYRGPTLGRGERMDYRRNAGNGTWIAVGVGVNKKGKRGYWTKVTGRADDYDNADPAHSIYDYFQAIDAAKELIRGRGRGSDAATAGSSAPVTSKGSLKAYEADLASRHAGVYNARHALVHLTPELANKAVAQHDLDELKRWKLSLRGKIADSTINRICGSICAAFELSAQSDKRIQNHDAWRIGLARLPGVEQARNIVISDAKVREFITAAYARDAGLGLLIETLAETGARPSQASRLCVEDLRDRQPKPSLMLPKSGKGGGRNRSEKKQERYSVPISAQLARKLAAGCAGAPGCSAAAAAERWTSLGRRCFRHLSGAGPEDRQGNRARSRGSHGIRAPAFQHRPDAAGRLASQAGRELARHERANDRGELLGAHHRAR
jgi:integrase